jgi:hypothetical protein
MRRTVNLFSPARVAILSVAMAAGGCSRAASTVTAPGNEVRALTGAHTRVVWVQGDGTDPDAVGDNLVLMGFDSDDGRGERVLLGQRQNYTTPRLTSRADRVVFTSGTPPKPSAIFVVNWDGSGLQKLADGFAMALWTDPADGRDWVYAGSDTTDWHFKTVTRFPLDAPSRREPVWNSSLVSNEGFQPTRDGRRAVGLFPYPGVGIADFTTKTWTKLGEGCAPSLTHARGPLSWYFDGAHRNVTIVDVDSGARWMVNINNAPGFANAEVSHPRWTNHPRFLAITGPYNQGGVNQARAGGKQTEVYLGRFSADFSKVEAWARVTNNAGGDSLPDVWIDADRSPYPRRPAGAIGPSTAAGAEAKATRDAPPDAGRLEITARLRRAGPVPSPQAILPYRHALSVSEYDVVEVRAGAYGQKAIRVAEWVIRGSRIVGSAGKKPGDTFSLIVDPYGAHPELEGERLIADSDASSLPLYYAVTP